MPAKTVARPTDEQIRARAYELYLQRGDRPGRPEDDWSRAVAELSSRKKRA